jgi:hypothetical protein
MRTLVSITIISLSLSCAKKGVIHIKNSPGETKMSLDHRYIFNKFLKIKITYFRIITANEDKMNARIKVYTSDSAPNLDPKVFLYPNEVLFEMPISIIRTASKLLPSEEEPGNKAKMKKWKIYDAVFVIPKEIKQQYKTLESMSLGLHLEKTPFRYRFTSGQKDDLLRIMFKKQGDETEAVKKTAVDPNFF